MSETAEAAGQGDTRPCSLAGLVRYFLSVSYTHLTLPTN